MFGPANLSTLMYVIGTSLPERIFATIKIMDWYNDNCLILFKYYSYLCCDTYSAVKDGKSSVVHTWVDFDCVKYYTIVQQLTTVMRIYKNMLTGNVKVDEVKIRKGNTYDS